MDWHVNWNIAGVQHPLYRHFHMLLLVMHLDSERPVAAAAVVVVDSLVVKSIVAAHMSRMYHQFVRKPIASVWPAVAAEYPMMMLTHVVHLKSKLKHTHKWSIEWRRVIDTEKKSWRPTYSIRCLNFRKCAMDHCHRVVVYE